MKINHQELIDNFKKYSSSGGFVSRNMIVILSALRYESSQASISHFSNDIHSSLKYFSETFLELKKLQLALHFKNKDINKDKNQHLSNPISINKQLIKDINAFLEKNEPKSKYMKSELNPFLVGKLAEYVYGQISKIYFVK